MKSLPLIFALVIPLAGCVTAEQQIALDDTKCQSYGVPKGSPAYVQCRGQLDQNRAMVQSSERFGNSGGLVGFLERQSSNN